MPRSPRPHGQVAPAQDRLNEEIRQLMDQEPSRQRYYRALLAWADGPGDETPEAA
ncbi:hypothetical protein ACNFR7_19475 [Streptomyces sp. RM1]|uniref:hypothetical protein n=1 Tax=Streptomyces misionensis TaxID=67331 RepID=UPI00396B8FC2